MRKVPQGKVSGKIGAYTDTFEKDAANEKASQLKVYPTPGDQDGMVERSISEPGDGDADPQ